MVGFVPAPNHPLTSTGHVFVTSALLGGQQKTSKFAAALDIKDEEIQQDALRGAVGAKINAQFVVASGTYSKGTGMAAIRTDQQYTDLSYLGMSASGGDTRIGSEYILTPWRLTLCSDGKQHTPMGSDGGSVQKLASD